MSWLKRKIRHCVAMRHEWFQRPWLRPLAPLLDHPALWALNRRKVAMGVAVGLFAGLMPGPTQKLTALALSLLLRVNLPVALVMTLYTNPLTVLPLYYLAYEFGKVLLGQTDAPALTPPPDWGAMSLTDWWQFSLDWLWALGMPLLAGLPALGVTLGAIGYVLTRVAWRWMVIRAWNKRKVKCGLA